MKKLLTVFIFLIPSMALAAGDAAAHHYDWAGLFWRIATSVVFIFILYKLLKNPIKKFVTNRSLEIETALNNALKANEEAKAKLRDYEEKVSKLEADLEAMKNNALKGAEKEREMILVDTEKSIEKMKKLALNMIEAETLKAKNDLRKELAELAVADAEKRLTEAVKGEKAKELLDQYIKRIGE